MKQCQRCGNVMGDDSAFCTQCGAELRGDAMVDGNAPIVEQPMEQSAERSAEQPMERLVEQPVERPVGQELNSRVVERPVEQFAERPVSQPMERPVEYRTEQPERLANNQPEGQSINEISANPNGATGTSNRITAAESLVRRQIDAAVDSQSAANVAAKKKANSKIAMLTAISAVCFIVGVIGIALGIIGFSQKGGDSGQVATIMPEGGGDTVDVVTSGTKVYLSGFEFVMPKEYEYEITQQEGVDILAFSDDSDYMAMTAYRDDLPFSAVKNRKDLIEDELSVTHGHTVTGNVRTVDGVEMVYFDAGIVDGMNMVYVVTNADLYSFMTVVVSEIRNIGTDYLSNVAKVLKTAEKRSNTNKAFSDSGFSDIKMPSFNIKIEE